MILAKYSDKPLIIDILMKSFDSNKGVNYAIKQDKKRNNRLRVLIEYAFELCWKYGEIYLTDNKKGVGLTLFPDKKKLDLNSIIWGIKLVFSSLGITRVLKVLKRESMTKKLHPKSLLYLWFIGVIPEYQGKGIGSVLLKEISELCTKRKMPIYLETAMEENIPFYQRLNFQLYKILKVPYTLFLFRKELTELVENKLVVNELVVNKLIVNKLVEVELVT